MARRRRTRGGGPDGRWLTVDVGSMADALGRDLPAPPELSQPEAHGTAQRCRRAGLTKDNGEGTTEK
ncbi:hypothetical protein GCM10009526_30410 [Glutamicibacter creatinolyticus]